MLTAKQAREITNNKIKIYHQECEMNSDLILPDVINQIETAANNKFSNIMFSGNMDYQTCVTLCGKLRSLGYVTASESQNAKGDFHTLKISW